MKLFLILASGLLSISAAIAQVPVSQEPRHHNVLDNGHVRLLNVQIPPGDTTQYHIHATPSVFVVLTDAHTGSEVISEEDRTASPIKHYGNIWFEGFYVKPRIHRVYNGDDHVFNVMDIELTNKNFVAIDPPISQAGFDFLFEEKPVRAYRLNLKPGEKLIIEPRKADILLIQLTVASADPAILAIHDSAHPVSSKTFHTKGDFVYIHSGSGFDLNNPGIGSTEFALFELK